MGIADLTGPRAKLGRADEHLTLLNEEFRRFVEMNANTVWSRYRREGEWDVVMLDPVPAVPPQIALIAGDCLNNLRTALDHLVWQLVLREDAQPRDRHCFPIYETRAEFINRVETPVRRGKKDSPLYGIPLGGDVWTLIETAQPYHCPEPKADELAVLARLTNFDKHRTLLVQQTFLTSGRVFWPADVQPIDVIPSCAPLATEHPTEVMRIRFAPGVNLRMDMEGKVSLTPTIGDGKTQAKITILADARRRVEKILKQVAALPRVQG